ncbi:peptidoglycan-binding protein [Thermodesulfobacteriota bacterium]
MQYGKRIIKRGLRGPDVQELQIRLAGFRGTIPDGIFGPGTELQIFEFQRDFMEMPNPSGIADRETIIAIDEFAEQYPIDFSSLRCPCGECEGFGQGRFKGKYRHGNPKLEMYYRYEYPGIHRMLLWAVMAIFFYISEYDFIITSGYRCGVNNEQKGRKSSNHHGKAIDLDVVGSSGEDKREDMIRCDRVRGIIVEHSNAQIGWHATNRKSLEPSSIAPTWIHYDVRSYERKYLYDRFFCKDLAELNNK